MKRQNISITKKLLIAGLILIIACDHSPEKAKSGKKNLAYEYYENGAIKSEAETKDGKAHGLLKNYTAGGRLESVYTFENGIRNGPAVTYYPNGQAREKKYYLNGQRHGDTKIYYRSGELYRVTPYENGKIEGIRITYYKDGKVMARAPYKNGFPGLGLKEYNMEGELLDNKVEISLSEENKLLTEDRFILYFRLEPSKPGTLFYIGELNEGKYLHEGLWPIEPKNDIARYVVKVHKESFRMETITISAQYRTDKSNYGVVSRKYNLAVDNK